MRPDIMYYALTRERQPFKTIQPIVSRPCKPCLTCSTLLLVALVPIIPLNALSANMLTAHLFASEVWSVGAIVAFSDCQVPDTYT